jgi:Ca2+-binding RTX toxin-like protein
MSAPKTVRAAFDNTATPTSSPGSVPAQTRSATHSFGYTASPGAGASLTVVELWIDGPGGGSFAKVGEKAGSATSGSFDPVTLDEGDGEYRLMTRARNNSGAYESGTPESVLLDTAAPSSTVTAGSTTQNVNAFDLTWTANGGADATGVSEIELWVDGPATAPAEPVATDDGAPSGTFTFTATEGAGAYAFHTRATDGVGNVEAAPVSPDVVVNVALCPGYESDTRVHVVGTAGNDVLVGTNAPEVICGLGGNDTMRGGLGGDLFIGDAGKDTVTYSERKAKTPVIVTINKGVNDGQKNEGDHVGSGIEILIGGAGNDTITGNGAKNTIKGGLGNDTIKGSGGTDKLYGEKGKDKLDGGPKKDVCKTGETYIGCEVRR